MNGFSLAAMRRSQSTPRGPRTCKRAEGRPARLAPQLPQNRAPNLLICRQVGQGGAPPAPPAAAGGAAGSPAGAGGGEWAGGGVKMIGGRATGGRGPGRVLPGPITGATGGGTTTG